MRNHRIKTMLAILLATMMGLGGTLLPVSAEALQESEVSVFAGGSGTQEDPFVIETKEQFFAFADSVNDGSAGGYAEAFIRLDTDIDLEGDVWAPIGNMGDMENFSTIFMGSFDGNGHTVSNLKLSEGDGSVGVGLFGVMTGSISNLHVQGFEVTVEGESSQAIGAVVGYLMYGSVENVSADGCSVSGNNCTGIIVGGEQYASLQNLQVTDGLVTVINDNDFSNGRLVQVDIAEVGGLIVGGAFGGNIYDCTAQGTVQATGNEPVGLGGIGGCLELMDNVINCDADVVISSPQGGHAIGGLCGYAGTHSDANVTMEEFGVPVTNYPAVIEDCDVTVSIDVPGATHVGGLVGTGLYYFGEETAFAISGCSVKGEINGAVTPGSVAGRAEGSTISDTEAEVTIDGEPASGQIGSTDRMYESADQYEEEAETEETNAEAEAETEAQVAFAGGAGTEEDPWQITTPEQLQAVISDLSAHYVLTADLDLSGYENWPMLGIYVMDEESESGEDPIPELVFTGTFDGGGHRISNLKIDASEDYEHMFGVGLFSCVGHGGVIRDLTLSDIDIKGMMLVGGVVGYAFECTIDNVDLTVSNPEEGRNSIESTMVMAGGIIGGLTCSECVNCDAEYTDIKVAPGGNCGVLGGGFSKPVLKNCTARNSSVKGEMGEVPMFGMPQGAWIGGLTGCVNLGEYNPDDWYVEDCQIGRAHV